MDKRNREILSTLVDRLSHLLRTSFLTPSSDTPSHSAPDEPAIYLWLMRLLILRALEARGFPWLRSPACTALFRQDAPIPVEDGWWPELRQACAELAQFFPGLFTLDDESLALPTHQDALHMGARLVSGQQFILPGITRTEIDATFAHPDLLGWAYQFYQVQARAEINEKCKHGGKVTNRAELAAKTQLFTEPYMVQWLLQNSLGRCYAEAYPHSELPAHWPYFMPPDPDEKQLAQRFPLEEITLFDPCMGCGHILRVAFDLLAAMYQEQHPEMSASAIAALIFRQHLSGVDLDPRAAQISALTLTLRAWEFISPTWTTGVADFSFLPEMQLATVPANFAPGLLQRHLRRFPPDLAHSDQLAPLFEDLEQLETLGSLFQVQATPTLLTPTLLEHIAQSYAAEQSPSDNACELLTRRAPGKHALLFHLLTRSYTFIVTNPPYLDSRDMSALLRKYIATHYPEGKRDLYAAFLLRCLGLCQVGGRIALVTMQSWLFNRSFADLRAVSEGKTLQEQGRRPFLGILRETGIEALVHLGAHAFGEITGEIVQCAMLTLVKSLPDREWRMRAWRCVGLKSAEEKRLALLASNARAREQFVSRPRQSGFLELAEAPVIYYLSDEFMSLIGRGRRLQTIAHVRQGLATADNARFTRCCWEIASYGSAEPDGSVLGRWFRYAKGGSYQKWAGLMWLVVDWEYAGRRIKLGVDAQNRPRYRDNAPQFAFQPGLTYTFIASGSFGPRILEHALFDVAGTALFPKTVVVSLPALAAVTSSRVVSYLLRVLTQDLKFNAGYVAQTPLPPSIPWSLFHILGSACISLKKQLVAQNPIEDLFAGLPAGLNYEIQAVLHSLEGWNEHLVCETYQLGQPDRQAIIAETGTPAGWYPLIADYDRLPDLSSVAWDEPCELPREFTTFLASHTRIIPTEQEMARTKARLRRYYAAGPRARSNKRAGAEEELSAVAALPLPAETFLEELSNTMRLHPLSVYWLLEELRATEDLHCEAEERRLLEERLSVLVLRLLGHRWPRQIERGEAPAEWAEVSGIIPLVAGTGECTLSERVHERLMVEEGVEGSQELERRLRALTGHSLEQWLSERFFEQHVIQFKRRPIAWHLASTPVRSDNQARERHARTSAPAFACLLFYHASGGALLERLRTHYLEPLLHTEREKLSTIDKHTKQPVLASSQARIRELEVFAAKLQALEEQGFACATLQEIAVTEPLDAWSGDGESPPANSAAFQRTEAAWRIDFNDGVRVNIAPLQLAGVLTRDVLTTRDAHKALSDRVHWRADERRWARAGKLPRCGWMEEVPGSSQQNYVPSL